MMKSVPKMFKKNVFIFSLFDRRSLLKKYSLRLSVFIGINLLFSLSLNVRLAELLRKILKGSES